MPRTTLLSPIALALVLFACGEVTTANDDAGLALDAAPVLDARTVDADNGNTFDADLAPDATMQQCLQMLVQLMAESVQTAIPAPQGFAQLSHSLVVNVATV